MNTIFGRSAAFDADSTIERQSKSMLIIRDKESLLMFFQFLNSQSCSEFHRKFRNQQEGCLSCDLRLKLID
jgi:hypothetical protein